MPAFAYVPGEVVIGWKPGTIAAAAGTRPQGLDEDRASPAWQQAACELAMRAGTAVLDVHPAYETARLAVPAGQEQAEIARLSALPWVRYAEPNYIAHATDYPNDPGFGDQWNLRRAVGPAAWDLTRGSYSIVVALVDSGADLSHPEFAGRLLPGYDYVNGDTAPNDDNGHGTHVAGILAAVANNATGITGLAPNVKLLPLKVLDAAGSGTYDNIATAIRRAADSNAQVINLSLGGMFDSDNLQDAVDYAIQRNCLVVAAAGNCAQGGSGCSSINPDVYPAAYPGVVAVAASDHYDNWASYSGYKPYVSLAAPGGTELDPIWSTVPGGYGWEHGTSMAVPLVSATAALIWTLAPTATYAQVAGILKDTADKVGAYTYVGGRNDHFGYGRLNAGRATRRAYPPTLTPITSTQFFLLGGPVAQQSIRLSLTNPSDQPISWQATVVEGVSWLSVSPVSGTVSFSSPAILTLQAGPTSLGTGQYDGVVQVRVTAPQPGSFNIYALLQVKPTLRRTYAPLLVNQHLAAAWIDPSGGGQPLNLTDNSARQLLLPFPVHFYGQTYNDIWVSDDGLASFGQPYVGMAYDRATCPPSAAAPNDTIYVLWDDLNPSLGGQVYAQKPDSQQYVITWYQVPQAAGGTPLSFQLVLLRDGGVLLQYRSVLSPISGTIGIENFDGTLANWVTCNGYGRPMSSGDAVLLSSELPW